MDRTSAAAGVLDEVAAWAGITTQPTTPRGATGILFEGHELGHVHANRGTLDLALPADRRAQVLEAGRAKEWFSKSLVDGGLDSGPRGSRTLPSQFAVERGPAL